MNVIELVTKYLPILDEQYRQEAKSSILDTPPAFVQETKDAKKVKIAKMNVDGLADYSRNSGFTTGSMDLTWEEHEYRIDRGRALQIDAMDNVETFGMAFGRLAGLFQRQKVVPEIDAYRFAEYYQHAGTQVALTVNAGKIMQFIDAADAQMDDDEVPEDNRILFVNPQVYKLMMNDPSIERYLSVTEERNGNITKKVYWYNNHRIIKVPSERFYTKINLLTGAGDQAVGGYTPATGAKHIGMLMIQPMSILQLSKRRIARVWAPTKEEAAGTDGVNPNADAWRFDFRIYHDAWMLEEKIAGVYAATIEGDGIDFKGAVAGTYNSTTKAFTDGGTTYKARTEGTTVILTGEVAKAAEDKVYTPNLAAGNRVAVRLYNTGVTKADLPEGNIAKVLGTDGQYTALTKTAFQDDGSLVLYYNVNEMPIRTAEITWVTGEVTTYVVNGAGCILK